MMSFGDLPQRSRLVLIQEIDEAGHLVASSLTSLRHLRYVVHDHAGVLALLAIGAEKMLKLTVGLAQVRDGGPWPTKVEMKRYGHGVSKLNAEAVALYEAGMGASTAPGTMRDLLDDWQQNTLGAALLDAASTWGSAGRFNRLDHLAGHSPGDTTENLWREVELMAHEMQPDLDFGDPTPGVYERNRAELNRRLEDALRRWWELHVRAWTTGILGEDVKGLGHALGIATKSPCQ